MIKEIAKSLVRGWVRSTSKETATVIKGPLRGHKLLTEHALPNLSMLFGSYEVSFASAFSQRIKHSHVTYDVGANTGYFSLLAASQSPTNGVVVAFEPVPEILHDLQRMVAANDFENRVKTSQIALSDSVGTVKLFTPASATSGVIETAIRHANIKDAEAIEVKTSTLDSYIYVDGNPPPDILKIDVEGAEASVLTGARELLKNGRPTILLEVHGEQPAADVWDIVVPLNYTIALIETQGERRIRDRNEWMNSFNGSKWTIQHCVLTPIVSTAAAA